MLEFVASPPSQLDFCNDDNDNSNNNNDGR